MPSPDPTTSQSRRVEDSPWRGDPFSPDPAAADRVIDQLADPDVSFRDLAADHNTTLEALTLWLARPEVDARLANLESAMARRTRLISANCFPAVITILKTILDEYNDEVAHIPVRPNNVYAMEQRRRSRETARRAAALLLRLAKFEPGLSPRVPPRSARGPSDSPSPREGTGGWVRPSPNDLPSRTKLTVEDLLALLSQPNIPTDIDHSNSNNNHHPAPDAAPPHSADDSPAPSELAAVPLCRFAAASPTPSPSHPITVSPSHLPHLSTAPIDSS